MGLIRALLGLLPGVGRTAEVFVENRTERARLQHQEQIASLGQFADEFANPRQGWFGALIDGLNRLPRPALAMGTLGLFVFAMADPVAFGVRMQGLALVPDPLWWLLGAIVSFYFGARELHHFRSNAAPVSSGQVRSVLANMRDLKALENTARPQTPKTPSGDANPALDEWRKG